jgi:hypothetical protein
MASRENRGSSSPLGATVVDVHRFFSLLCARRGLRNVEHEQQRTSVIAMLQDAKKAWHGIKLNQPEWGDGLTAWHSVANCVATDYSSTSSSTAFGNRWSSNCRCRRSVHGGAGSTRHSIRRTTSFPGTKPPRCPAAAIESRIVPWRCSTRASMDERLMSTSSGTNRGGALVGKKKGTFCFFKQNVPACRDDRIRTCDLLTPSQAR